MTDKLREAVQAAMDALFSGDPRRRVRAALNLHAALAEPAIKESLTPQRPWVGLTDEEVNLIYAEPQTHVGQYAKAIEAKLKEKNGEHI